MIMEVPKKDNRDKPVNPLTMNGMIAIMHKQNEPIAIKYFICFLKYSAVEDPARIPAIFPPLFLILFAISSGFIVISV